MLIVARQAQQESCLFGGLDENDRKFSIWKGYSRAINYQTVLSRPVRRAAILSWGGARSFKCYSQTGLLHFSLSYSAEKVNLDLWSKEFMFGRGVRWYLVQIYYCGAALHRMIELRKETLQKKKKESWESVIQTKTHDWEGDGCVECPGHERQIFNFLMPQKRRWRESYLSKDGASFIFKGGG